MGGSSLREGLWNVLALLGADRSEHSNIMAMRSTEMVTQLLDHLTSNRQILVDKQWSVLTIICISTSSFI